MITNLEELSLNAWAALQTMLYDGWVIRFAEGYTKRANSVNPLYPSTIDVEEKIQYCETVYQKQNLPVVFKLTTSAFPSDLDEQLQANGYRKDSPTSVQTIHLDKVNTQTNVKADLHEHISEDWLDSFCRMSEISNPHRPTLQKILLNIVPSHCFVSIKQSESIVACGLGVAQSGYVGLFDIVTDKDFRKRGYGGQIVRNILAWGKQNQAGHGYLQVMLNNPPALQLYAKIGFVEQYQYWYRIKP